MEYSKRRTLMLAKALLLSSLSAGFLFCIHSSSFFHEIVFGRSSIQSELSMNRKMDLLFQCFKEGWSPYDDDQPYIASGWMMELPNGQIVQRCDLQRWAKPLIAYGPKAVPYLVKWVRYDHCAVRYIAIYALDEITQEKPMVYHFASGPNDPNTESAIQIWLKWWKSNQTDTPPGS